MIKFCLWYVVNTSKNPPLFSILNLLFISLCLILLLQLDQAHQLNYILIIYVISHIHLRARVQSLRLCSTFQTNVFNGSASCAEIEIVKDEHTR